MGRGARQQAYNAQTANQQKLYGTLNTVANKIPDDLTGQQKAGVTQAAMGGISTGIGNMQDEAKRSASATGSSAALPEMMNETGLEGTREKATAGSQLQEYFAQVPVQRALAKAGVYLPMYGTTTTAMGAVAPQPDPNYLQSLIGAAGTAAGGFLSRPK
jgi:hypothetical protein